LVVTLTTLLNPSFEATTFGQMVTHLSTVHLPIYIGVVGVLLTTSWTLVNQMRRSKVGIALPAAFVGALLSAAGEGWHAERESLSPERRNIKAERRQLPIFIRVSCTKSRLATW
jgi:hypothetical protein